MKGEMSKIDSNHSSATSFPASVSGFEATRRLIVLIPDLEWDYLPAIYRVWELAYAQQARVLLLSLCKDPKQELSLRRALVILCAMVQDGRIPVETNVEIGVNWVDAIKINYEEGDVLVCFADQWTGFLQRPLSQILESSFNVPVYILSGLSPQKSKSNMLSQGIAWLGFIGIIVSFGLLQAQALQLPEGWLQNVLLIFSIIPEFWLVLLWNNLFS